jgi:type I restriction enzyme R subunit
LPGLTEADVEDATLGAFAELGYAVASGPEIAPDGASEERKSYADVVLLERLEDAIWRLNLKQPADAQLQAIRRLIRRDSPLLEVDNRAFHRMLVDGVPVEYTLSDGRVVGDRVRLIDFAQPENNDWLVVNQFTVVEDKHNRRPDVVVFVNGLPLGVFELKDAGNPAATVVAAYQQLQTYKAEIPSLMVFNELLVTSDWMTARVGSLTADVERFMPWRTVAGEEPPSGTYAELPLVIRGLFEKERLLRFLRHFVVFDDDGVTLQKKVAAYHQFHAVNHAVEETLRAASQTGDRRAGVVWHTQGSGKSLTMAFYAGRLIAESAMDNPTIVVITDRNDLDEQLFGTFARCQDLMRQVPQQARDREHLRELLHVASGGVVFTTIQKFLPTGVERNAKLSDRRNIVVIADEAHRSQYDFIDGYARHMHDALPHASFIGFTGTPIELADRSTKAIFGEYIDVYDILQSVADGATVPIYYESRLAKLELNEAERPVLDPTFDELTENEEDSQRQRLRSKWAALESLVGTEKRLQLLAEDLVAHYEDRAAAMEGKAMVVAMSRRICADLYRAIVQLRPSWHHDDDAKGAIKVVMTGSASDPSDLQPHIRSKAGREAIAKRFKAPDDPLKLVIVRDMWLTGFDVPCLHTMYVDKPMQGHALMQAIARVNRVFRDKPGGLVVDYLGLAEQLKQALASYSESGGKGETAIDQNEAVAVMLEKHEVVTAMFHGFDYELALASKAAALGLLPGAIDHILGLDDGKKRFADAVADLSKAFALAIPRDEALVLRDEVGFFQTIRGCLVKPTPRSELAASEMEHAVQQLISRAITPAGVVDIFALAGLEKPDISILSDSFLAEIRGLPQKNLAIELLERLLGDEIQHRSRKNLVASRSFAAMLEQALRRYQNRGIQAAEVIEQLIQLAKEMKEAEARGDALGLTSDELAFYSALETNDSAVQVLGDETLRMIARELVEQVRRNTSIDWTLKESARARLRVLVKRILNKYGYPPDKQERATQTVLEQAALLSDEWVTE